MAGYQREIFIEASARDIVAFTVDPKNASRVASGVTEMVQLDAGPVRPGTRFRETRVVHGKPHTTDMALVAFDPESGFVMRAETSGIEVTYTYEVSALDGGSRVALRCEVRGRGLKRLVAPLVAMEMAKMDGDQLERLRAAMLGG
jgi:hypothetical protein